tara:strand:- start:102244 stop:104085 length:1842 start_codon:yes stop_codon:yes gene_type:complete
MHAFRTHNCAELRKGHVGQSVKLSGWVNRKRDHGGLLFIDLRDTYGITQIVIDSDSPILAEAEKWRNEFVICFTGKVVERSAEVVNSKLPTGDIEVRVEAAEILSEADIIPFQVAEDDHAGEDIRLRYRYLDLRRENMQKKIRLRNNVIASIRRRMWEQNFQEFNTPILTASSPEGARDFLVPSRLHPGKFYALPQAPQQFKQLLMMSGFDRYFQVAPCFRDEDSRADRLAEFYQLDVEMSFVTENDIYNTMEPVLQGLFEEFSDFTGEKRVPTQAPFPRIAYDDAMLKYGSDKPDLRNPLEIADVTDIFSRDDVEFRAFKSVIEDGGVVRAIPAPKVSDKSRKFYDSLNDWARGEGAPGLGYIIFADGAGKGPISKFVPAEAQDALKAKMGLGDGDAVFFVCDKALPAAKLAGKARDKICDAIEGLRETGVFKFCWIVDYPLYEINEETGKVDFSHNPFSMPQGGLAALEVDDEMELLNVKAHQYDCVCNGYELCSGAIRNHKPEIMIKAFGAVGYDQSVLEDKFGGMLNAMRFGAPPHGGCAFGIDRMVMIFCDEPNLREVNAFVMNGQFEDLLMNAPSETDAEQLKDLHIKTDMPKPKITASDSAEVKSA